MFPNIEEFADPAVVTVDSAASIGEALDAMVEHDVRGVVITGTEPRGYGILTASDVIRARSKGVAFETPLSQWGYKPLPRARAGDNVLDILSHFGEDLEHICVLDDEGALLGVVSYGDVIARLDPNVMIENRQIGELARRRHLRFASPGATLGEVLADIDTVHDAVAVLDGDEPVGIVTSKDAIALLTRQAALEAPVSEHMLTPLHTVDAGMSVRDALEHLRSQRHHRLVVREADGGIAGMVTERDIVSAAYNHWVEILQHHAGELRELVTVLERKAQRLEKMAATDALTGIANRKKFEQTLQAEIERCDRYRTDSFSLLMLDIDDFKAVNDRWGHPCGDEVLKAVAAAVQETVRTVDLFARWGGEEFVVLLPHTALEGARVFAERARAAIARIDIPGPGTVTVSIGVAQHQDGEIAHDLLRRADRALYRAKARGKDRVEVDLLSLEGAPGLH